MVVEGMLRVYGMVVMAVNVLLDVRERVILLGLVAEACWLRKCRLEVACLRQRWCLKSSKLNLKDIV